MRKTRVIDSVVLGIGLILFAVGIAGILNYTTISNAQTISGTKVIDLTKCSNGYAAGQCPVVSYDWSGSLVSPNPNSASAVTSIWGINGDDACGFPTTYSTSIPDAGTNPMYLPITSAVAGITSSGSVVYVYTSHRYTLADGCGGTLLPGTTNGPLPISISYSVSQKTTTFSSMPIGNDFFTINISWALIGAGAFTTVLGLFLVFGDRTVRDMKPDPLSS